MPEILEKLLEAASGATARAQSGRIGDGPHIFARENNLDLDEIDEMAKAIVRQVDAVRGTGIPESIILQSLCQTSFQVGYLVARDRFKKEA